MQLARSIPDALSRPLEIRELRLEKQDLEYLPEQLSELRELRILNLRGNRLPFLPDSLASLAKLEDVLLSDNRFSTFPAVLSDIYSIRRLDLDHNDLQAVPGAIGQLRALQYLNLSHNPLSSSLPPELYHLTALESLQLAGTRNLLLHPHVRQWTRLKYLDVSGSGLWRVEPNLALLPALEHLLLAESEFAKSPVHTEIAPQVTRFFKETANGDLPLHQRRFLLNVLLMNTADFAEYAAAGRWQALDASLSQIRENALQLLHNVLPNPLDQAGIRRLVWIGQFSGTNRTQMKRALREHGISVGGNARGEDCAVIVGTRPGSKLDQALASGVPVGVPGHLQDFLHRQAGRHLQAGAGGINPMADKITRLLASYRPDNVQLALVLMEGGGIPEAALSDLLFCALYGPSLKIRGQARKVFDRFAGQALVNFVALTLETHRQSLQTWGITFLMEQLGAHARLDAVALVRAAVLNAKTGPESALRLPVEMQAELFAGILQQQGHLSMDAKGLKAMPESLSDVSALQDLHITRNKLRTLPGSIRKLTELKVVSASLNSIRELPPEIGALKKLETLDLSDNLLHGLPVGIGQCIALKNIRLDRNPLQSLPEALLDLPELALLSLHGCNKFHAFPNFIWRHPTLKDLNLGGCDLEELPADISGLAQLGSLQLDHNELQELPEWIGALPRLRFLDLSYTPAARLPESLRTSTSLERIYLQRDGSRDWEQVVDVLREVPSLRNVYLKHGTIVREVEDMIGDRLPDGVKITLAAR